MLGALTQSINSEQMRECIKNDLKKYKEHFDYCAIYQDEQYKKITLQKRFAFVHSGNYLLGESYNDIYGIYDHFRVIDAYIYNEYINNSIINNVSTIDEIISNIDDNEIILICAIKYHMYIHTLKNIQYEGPDCIKYKGRTIKFIFDRNISDYIIIRNKLKESIFMQEIKETSLIPTIRNKGKIPDVVISYEPNFYINIKSDIKVYSIIGVKDIEEITYGI